MSKSKKILFVILTVAALACLGVVLFWQLTRYELVDTEKYDKLLESMAEKYTSFESNDEYREELVQWVRSTNLTYTLDDASNLIVTVPPAAGHEDDAPDIICTEYNYKLSAEQLISCATAKYLATNASSNAPTYIIFFNNDKNLNKGITSIDSKYFTEKSKIIYLTAGGKMRTSISSFAMATENIKIPLKRKPRTCDTGIKLKISGISTDNIGSNISKYPNPLTQLSAILTKLSGKSVTYEVTDVSIENEGNMYPDSLSATILVNSYSLEDVTEYIDKRIESVTDDFSETCPDIKFTYEVIDGDSALPSEVYSPETSEILNNLIYTVVNGLYKFKEDEEIPEGFKAGDICAVNCMKNFYVSGDTITIKMYTAAADEEHLDAVLSDNRTAAKFTGAKLSGVEKTPAFAAAPEFSAEISELYQRVNRGANMITMQNDKEFTACSYLSEICPNAQIVHLVESEKTAVKITNTLLNYLAKTAED